MTFLAQRTASPSLTLGLMDTQQTLVVECARDHAYLHHLRELLLGIVCQTAAVGASSLSLEIAVARGRGLRLFTLPEDERRVLQWTTQVDRVIECIRQADFCADPGALSLFNLPRSSHTTQPTDTLPPILPTRPAALPSILPNRPASQPASQPPCPPWQVELVLHRTGHKPVHQ